jgi:NTP pyrophosphatase (non-canonical NTP hydrolase)
MTDSENTSDPLHQRGMQARQNLFNALRECGELADAVEHFEGQELLDVLDYLDSLRFVMAESGQLLAGVVRGDLNG